MKKKTMRMLGALLLSAATLVLATGCPQSTGDKKTPSVPTPEDHPLKDTVWKLTKVKGVAVSGGDTLYIYFVDNGTKIKLAKENGGTKNKSNRTYAYMIVDGTPLKLTCADLGFNNADLVLMGGTPSDQRPTAMKISDSTGERIAADRITDNSVTVAMLEGADWTAVDLTNDFKNN